LIPPKLAATVAFGARFRMAVTGYCEPNPSKSMLKAILDELEALTTSVVPYW